MQVQDKKIHLNIMVKVLCLHGFGQTGEIFEHQLNRLCVKLSSVAEFDFVDAPYPLPHDHTGSNSIATYSWCRQPCGEEPSEADDDYSIGDAVVKRHMAAEGMRYDVILGFSQGGLVAARYVMLRELHGGDGYGPPLKGLILAATPDPRRTFPGLASGFKDSARYDAENDGFLGPLPSLHIVGRKDGVVDPAESASFADACRPHADVLWHEHAHSFPTLQNIVMSLKSFFERIAQRNPGNDGGDSTLTAACEEELEMISCVYGEECVHRGKMTIVSLPLLLNCADGDLEGSPLAALRLCVALSKGYPAEIPKFDIVGGPSNHHVFYERWRAKLVSDTTAFMREGPEGESGMLLPAIMFTGEQAVGALDFLKSVFAEGGEMHDSAGVATGEQWKERKVNDWLWEEDDSEGARSACIAESHRRAQEVLAGGSPSFRPYGRGDCEGGGCYDAGGRGRSLEFTIGLIGKPSAGKSTFYNAVTNPDNESKAARVAAFPFTTIEPNVGCGFGPIFCPCSLSQPLPSSTGQCGAKYGHVTTFGAPHRRHPIVVKDVAGLVQGAYRGKGKGNRFLNDLCDADVLVHIVDGAGATYADGSACAPGEGSTFDDIMWVRGELHSWIYDNLRAQWAAVVRKPLKIRTVFTGYHSPPSSIDALLRCLGISTEVELVRRLPAWGAAELHLLVATFVHLRFPIVVALNKADMRCAADKLICTLKERYPNETLVQMSAKMECNLLFLRQAGAVRYVPGDHSFEEVDGAPANVTDAVRKRAMKALVELREFFSPMHPDTTTGVQAVLAAALSLCPGHLVYPVDAIERPLNSFPHCFPFRGGTCAGEVFDALLRSNLLDGKLVRFEAVDTKYLVEGGEVSVLKRDTVLPGRHVVVRVLSTKRHLVAQKREGKECMLGVGPKV